MATGDVTLFLCGAAGEDFADFEVRGLVDTRDAPGRDEGCCDACGEPLEIDHDDGAAEYQQACGYCGRALYCADGAR